MGLELLLPRELREYEWGGQGAPRAAHGHFRTPVTQEEIYPMPSRGWGREPGDREMESCHGSQPYPSPGLSLHPTGHLLSPETHGHHHSCPTTKLGGLFVSHNCRGASGQPRVGWGGLGSPVSPGTHLLSPTSACCSSVFPVTLNPKESQIPRLPTQGPSVSRSLGSSVLPPCPARSGRSLQMV